MKATVVVDNRKNGALSGEWGLCIYIEHGEKRIRSVEPVCRQRGAAGS